MRENGTAVLAKPTNNSGPHSPRSLGARRVAAAKSASTRAASPTRSPTSTKGPSAGTATRMNRKDAPHSAPKVTSAAAPRPVKPGAPKGRSRARAQHAALVLQQPLLEVQAPVEPAERPVGGDDPVARHHQRQPVGGVGPADGPRRAGAAEPVRYLPVRARLPVGDARKLRPYRLLPLRADERERQPELPALAGVVLAKLLPRPGGPPLVA